MGELRSKLINSSNSQMELTGAQQGFLPPSINSHNTEFGKRYLRSSDDTTAYRPRHPLDGKSYFQGYQSNHAEDFHYPQKHLVYEVK